MDSSEIANAQRLALFDILAAIQSSKRSRIAVCIHLTAAKNLCREFYGMCRDAQLPCEWVNDKTFEVRALNQWQRVYFVSALQDPDFFQPGPAEVFLLPGSERAIMSSNWRSYAAKKNAEWGKA